MQEVVNRLKASQQVVYDSETSGLDWRKNHICGHVFSFGPAPSDSYYIPVRHLGSDNVGGAAGPTTEFNWDGKLHPVEKVLLPLLDRPDVTMTGHNLAFDLKFLSRVGFQLKPRCEDTIINEPLINEWAWRFGLEHCANRHGVQAKKSAEIIAYLCSLFPAAAADPKRAMGHFWRLSGTDPVGTEYATGDGTSTWQLRNAQMKELSKQDEDGDDLLTVWDVESRLIPVLARMSIFGIKIDEGRLAEVRKHIKSTVETLMNGFPSGFNPDSPNAVRHWMEDHGVTNWPMTAPSKKFPNGQPSFRQEWLEQSDPGKAIVRVRKFIVLRDRFIMPLQVRHLWRGRVHTTFNQLRGDEFGTITGRLSSQDPNLQAITKHDVEIGRLLRSVFVADKYKTWASVDYSQCLVAGTKISIPGGTKNIEDMKPGDLVYSYDQRRNLVLRKVTWAGQTGVRPVCRTKWVNDVGGGHLDMTPDHKIRLFNGEYRMATELIGTQYTKVLSPLDGTCITHIIPLPGTQPVYDITVEDTHNFIANEICVHNCEPRLLAFYSGCRVLVDGYNADPSVDAHTAVAIAANRDWFSLNKDEQKFYRNQYAKRINQTIITGGGKNVLVYKYKIDPREVDTVWNNYHSAMPEIRRIQKKMTARMEKRGYLKTLLRRRCRLKDRDKSYVALNRALQGGNADILKLKLVEVDDYLAGAGRPVDVLNNCHDAFDLQFTEANRPHYEECLRVMQNFGPDQKIYIDNVPMPVDAEEGKSWAEATYGEEH